ncbi:MAG: hypothetical protein M1817_002346 [Caeruleum heppii]|nr:MAG: hypothetical protein M1817_003469 [Caeruleum heppii]KAI9673708.1 MAG: hypothetical protein M1817_002346 [Caeruleum heppii]
MDPPNPAGNIKPPSSHDAYLQQNDPYDQSWRTTGVPFTGHNNIQGGPYPQHDPHLAAIALDRVGGNGAFAGRYGVAASFDPDSMMTAPAYGVNRFVDYASAAPIGATIAPQALQTELLHEERNASDTQTPEINTSHAAGNATSVASPALAASPFQIPPGQTSGSFCVVGQDFLSSSNFVPFQSGPFAHIGQRPIDAPTSRTTLTAYVPRYSRNQVRRLLDVNKRSNDNAVALNPKQERMVKRLKISNETSLPKSRRSQNSKTSSRVGSSTVETPSSDSESESSEDESDQVSSPEEVMEEAPLPPTRPTKSDEAAAYDTIKALWRPSNRRILPADEIREAMLRFWTVLKPIQDEWNAIAKDEALNKDGVKQRFAKQRAVVMAVFKAVLEHGHHDVVERLGGNILIVVFLSKILLNRAKEEDYNGELTLKTLELMSRIKNITKASLEKVKFSKLEARLLKKGNAHVKAFLKNIGDNANAPSQPTVEGAATTPPAAANARSPSSTAAVGARSGNIIVPVSAKRAREDGDSSNQQPPKRPASASGTSQTPRFQGNARPASATDKRTTSGSSGSKAASKGGNGTTTTQGRTTQVAQKPTTFFSELKSASKPKPAPVASQTPAVRAASQSRPNVKAESTARTVEMAPARPSFSIADTLAALNKPDPPPETKPVGGKDEEKEPETEAQKAWRLRKQARRHLRVHFAPREELEQVRFFTHDVAEEMGREDNLLRDAGDAGQEGRIFKQEREKEEKGDGLVEDEEELPGEESLLPFESPAEVDFSVIDAEELQKNYVCRGGFRESDSPERLVQTQREATTLMVVYTDDSSIPASAREPSVPESTDRSGEIPFGPPSELTRSRQPGSNAATQAPPTQPVQAQPPNLAAIIGALQRQQQPQPTPTPAAGQFAELEKVFAQFAQKLPGTMAPAPPQAPAPQPPQPSQFFQPPMQAPAAFPPPAQPAPDLQKLLAALQPQGNNAGQNSGQASYPVPPVPSMGGQVNPQLQAILAQLGRGQQGTPPVLPGFGGQVPPPPPGFAFPPFSGAQNGANNNPAGSYGGNQYNGGFDHRGQGHGSGGNQQSRGWDGNEYDDRRQGAWGRGRPVKDSKRHTVPCKYFSEGNCLKGDHCNFLHEK